MVPLKRLTPLRSPPEHRLAKVLELAEAPVLQARRLVGPALQDRRLVPGLPVRVRALGQLVPVRPVLVRLARLVPGLPLQVVLKRPLLLAL